MPSSTNNINLDKIGFIGAGLMGYGMASNLLKNKYPLTVICHKNRSPIEKLINEGAIESSTYKELVNFSDVIILCVTNTLIAINIISEALPFLKENTLIIDITTHSGDGSIKLNNLFKTKKIRYVESPVMGGPVQSQEGILGAIVGCNINDFNNAKNILLNFCKEVIHFGEIGTAAKTKLLSNFLSLGTTTFVIETLKIAEKFNIDLKKLYQISKLGSGNSGALNRIAEKAIEGDYKGYIFTVNNTLKDLTYINDLVKDIPSSEKLSSIIKSLYQEAVDKGKGDLFISELIKE